jgi:hypothetical protein
VTPPPKPKPVEPKLSDETPNDASRIQAVADRLQRAGWATTLTAWSWSEARKAAAAIPMRMSAAGRLEFYTCRSILETRIVGGRVVHPMSIGVATEGRIAVKALEAEGFRTLWSGGDGDPILLLAQPNAIGRMPWFWGLGRIAVAGAAQHLWPAGLHGGWTTFCGGLTIQGDLGPIDIMPTGTKYCPLCEQLAKLAWRRIEEVPRDLPSAAQEVAPSAMLPATSPTPVSVAVEATEPPAVGREGAQSLSAPSVAVAAPTQKPAKPARKKKDTVAAT